MMPRFSVDDMTVLIVTFDSVFWCSAAYYEMVMPRVLETACTSQVYVEQCVRRLDT